MLPSFSVEKYSPEKLLAAQLLATKDEHGMTDAKIAQEVGCDLRTLYRWKNSPDFIEALLYYSELSMEAFTSELYASLKKAVRQGSTRAMELILKNRGKLIDRKEVSGNLTVEQTVSLTQDVLLEEIEQLKVKVLANTPEKRALPQVVVDVEYEEC